jgi:RNA polymerase primary sigma factor
MDLSSRHHLTSLEGHGTSPPRGTDTDRCAAEKFPGPSFSRPPLATLAVLRRIGAAYGGRTMTFAAPFAPSPPCSANDLEGGRLHTYFRDLANHGTMSAEDEVAAARMIAELRRRLWTTILGYPPVVVAVAELIQRRVPVDEGMDRDIAGLRAASRALRDRDTRANLEVFEASRGVMVERMLRLDLDGAVADEIAGELRAIVAGGPGERTLVLTAAPRQGSRPFDEYTRTIQATMTALRAARGKFVEANLRLVVVIARRYNRGAMTLADRIQEGNLGLIKAVGRFDPARGFRFSTYAAWWIRHAITRALADKDRAIRLPVHLVEAMHRLARARHELRAAHGCEPDNDVVAAHTGLSLARIDRIDALQSVSTISLEPGRDDDDARGLHDTLTADDDEVPGERLDAAVILDHVRDAFAKLRPIEAEILRQRFGLADEQEQEQTLRELAARHSLSRERIRQLQEQALDKLRSELRRREIV